VSAVKRAGETDAERPRWPAHTARDVSERQECQRGRSLYLLTIDFQRPDNRTDRMAIGVRIALDNRERYAYLEFITPVAPCHHPLRRQEATRKTFELTAQGPQRQARQHEAIQGNRRLPPRVLDTSTRGGARPFEACAHIRPRLDVLPIIAFRRRTLPSSTAGAHHLGRQRVDHRSRSLPRPLSRLEEGARETCQRPLWQQPARHPSC
jgi:hypothetical protein